MTDTNSKPAVIVGIDGSDAAIRAAEWAIDEAVARGIPLRLVSVDKSTHSESGDDYDDIHHAKAALQAASSAVEATGKAVDIETDVIEGRPGTALAKTWWNARMICVGSIGIGRYARSILGSTVTELAKQAHCPVAVIRPSVAKHDTKASWIVVAATRRLGHDMVIKRAMEEAALRGAPVLLLGDKKAGGERAVDKVAAEWRQRYPGVHIFPIAKSADVAHFLKKHDQRIQLAVIGAADVDELAEIVGPKQHVVFHHTDSSALVVR
jgi:nucleotide-binding universal stress UspA family protein